MTSAPGRGRLGALVSALCWAYAASVLAVLVLVRWLGAGGGRRCAPPCTPPWARSTSSTHTCDSLIFGRYWSGYLDAFSEAGFEFGHTWFSRWHGLRIDHLLAGPGWDVGSDHRPLIAELDPVDRPPR